MIEVIDYEIFVISLIMESDKSVFWHNVAKYSQTKNEDQTFVNEVAYVMVTLHRTGA